MPRLTFTGAEAIAFMKAWPDVLGENWYMDDCPFALDDDDEGAPINPLAIYTSKDFGPLLCQGEHTPDFVVVRNTRLRVEEDSLDLARVIRAWMDARVMLCVVAPDPTVAASVKQMLVAAGCEVTRA